MALEARHLTHRFGPDVPVLDAVDLSIEPGRSYAVIGPNGAGKSTLVRLLAGLLAPTSGHVLVDDASLQELDRRTAARRISVVPQARPSAFAFTALEFVLMGFHARQSRFSLDGAAQRDAALRALERLQVGALAGRSMTTLSGGEAQRVVMARTIVSDAVYWLLDEPTASLDVAHRVALMRVVREHCDGGGAALAVVHDINLVERWFDEVIVIAGGVIVARGKPADTLHPDLLEAAFGIAMRRIWDGRDAAWIPAPSMNVDPDGVAVVRTGGPGGDG